MYKPSDLTGPKEINHDVMFREGQNLEVCTLPVSIIKDQIYYLHGSSAQTLQLLKT